MIVGILLMVVPSLMSIHWKYENESQPTAKPITWSKTKCPDCGLPVEICMCDPELEE